MQPIRTFLVDDNPKFLEAAKSFLATSAQFEIVGHANSGREALEQIPELHPDLVLLDLVMPDVNGLEVTRQLKIGQGAPHIIILTLHDNAAYHILAQTVEADGFVSKADFGTELLPLVNKLFFDSNGAAPGNLD